MSHKKGLANPTHSFLSPPRPPQSISGRLPLLEKVTYALGHIDLKLRRMLITVPKRPVSAVLEPDNAREYAYGV